MHHVEVQRRFGAAFVTSQVQGQTRAHAADNSDFMDLASDGFVDRAATWHKSRWHSSVSGPSVDRHFVSFPRLCVVFVNSGHVLSSLKNFTSDQGIKQRAKTVVKNNKVGRLSRSGCFVTNWYRSHDGFECWSRCQWWLSRSQPPASCLSFVAVKGRAPLHCWLELEVFSCSTA